MQLLTARGITGLSRCNLLPPFPGSLCSVVCRSIISSCGSCLGVRISGGCSGGDRLGSHSRCNSADLCHCCCAYNEAVVDLLAAVSYATVLLKVCYKSCTGAYHASLAGGNQLQRSCCSQKPGRKQLTWLKCTSSWNTSQSFRLHCCLLNVLGRYSRYW